MKRRTPPKHRKPRGSLEATSLPGPIRQSQRTTTQRSIPSFRVATDEIENAEARAETDADPASQAGGSDAQPTRKVALGKIGYDEQGRSGRIHVVVPGDTLWDISDAYLGTPWVWPSVWTDNRDIENPHFIVPGDRIWISCP